MFPSLKKKKILLCSLHHQYKKSEVEEKLGKEERLREAEEEKERKGSEI